MNKWGDKKVNGPERIVAVKILPVPISLDGRKIQFVVWRLLRWVFALPRMTRNEFEALAKTKQFAIGVALFGLGVIFVITGVSLCLLIYIMVMFIKIFTGN